jgi:hypothetical protein
MIRIRRWHASGMIWLWAAYRTSTSPKPFAASRSLERLMATLKRRDTARRRAIPARYPEDYPCY